MDLATIAGMILGMGLVGTGMYLNAAQQDLSMLKFFEITSLLIVLGGTLAATAIAFPLNEVKRVMGLIGIVFKKSRNENLGPLVDDIVELSSVARKGIRELELASEKIHNKFLKDGIDLVSSATLDDVREIMETSECYRFERETNESNLMKSMGIYSPAFGMVGTLIGLIMMLYGMGKGDSSEMMSTLGGAMGVALITTFYGALFSNLIFLPFSDKLRMRNQENSLVSSIIVEGVCLIHQKKHPILVREKLNSFLPPRERKTEES